MPMPGPAAVAMTAPSGVRSISRTDDGITSAWDSLRLRTATGSGPQPGLLAETAEVYQDNVSLEVSVEMATRSTQPVCRRL